MRSHVIHRDDVRVIQEGGGARFLSEPRQPQVVGRKAGRQDLQGDVAVQARVARLIDVAHPAAGDQIVHLVGSEMGAGLKVHSVCPFG